MRKRMYIFLLILLILSTDVVFGNGSNKTNTNKASQNRHVAKSHARNDRPKRALPDEEDHPFWPNRGKKELSASEEPFWGNRGRRDLLENYADFVKPYTQNKRICDNCFPAGNHDAVFGNVKHAREDVSPFWGMRGRRDSDEMDGDLFWGSRGRRQEDDPFWGNRGRRQEDSLLWGNRGRREEEPFWGNRGRREEEPFWGNRGRRQESPFWGTRGRRENDDPFWGNRGRREEPEPFWGNRGRREEYEPFWGNRGRRKETDPFWSSHGRRKQDLKDSILNAINVVENDIENLSRLRRSNDEQYPVLPNKFTEGKLAQLSKKPRQYHNYLKSKGAQLSEPGTVLDNTMYAEQPGYILVDRTSRSSAEDDPYFISRGKKYYLNFDYEKAARGRRGAIEEIVKSVRNDPYYIARGKKDADSVQIGNSTLSQEEFLKARELICATIDLVMLKNDKNKTKRNDDSERDRRTILKKLAAQLQIDPYFVSRGKKNDSSAKETIGTIEDGLEDFINEVASKCN